MEGPRNWEELEQRRAAHPLGDQHSSNGRSRLNQDEESMYFEELELELKKLQMQLEEHGKAVFGSEVPNQRTPAPVSAQPRPPLVAAKPEQQKTLEEDLQPRSPPPRRQKQSISHQKHVIESQKREIEVLKRKLSEDKEELCRLRALQGATEAKMADRVARLEERVRSLIHRENDLEKRRVSDAQGWRAELTALRQQLQSVDRRQKKLAVICNIADEDRRAAVLARHKNLESQQRGVKKSSGDKEKVRHSRKSNDAEEAALADEEHLQGCLIELSEELSALKLALGGLEEQFMRY